MRTSGTIRISAKMHFNQNGTDIPDRLCTLVRNANSYSLLESCQGTMIETSAAAGIATLERAEGIEPSYAAWEAAVLPLNYARELIQ